MCTSHPYFTCSFPQECRYLDCLLNHATTEHSSVLLHVVLDFSKILSETLPQQWIPWFASLWTYSFITDSWETVFWCHWLKQGPGNVSCCFFPALAWSVILFKFHSLYVIFVLLYTYWITYKLLRYPFLWVVCLITWFYFSINCLTFSLLGFFVLSRTVYQFWAREIFVMPKIFHICVLAAVITSHVWLSNTWNVTSEPNIHLYALYLI